MRTQKNLVLPRRLRRAGASKPFVVYSNKVPTEIHRKPSARHLPKRLELCEAPQTMLVSPRV